MPSAGLNKARTVELEKITHLPAPARDGCCSFCFGSRKSSGERESLVGSY